MARTTSSMRRFSRAPVLLALALLGAAGLARAMDTSSPFLSNLRVTDCNGNQHGILTTNISNPSISVTVQDSQAGLHLLDGPLIAGTSTSNGTLLFYDFNSQVANIVVDTARLSDGKRTGNDGRLQNAGANPAYGATTHPNGAAYGDEFRWTDQPATDTTINGITVGRSTTSASLTNLETALTIEAWVKLGRVDTGPIPLVEFSTTAFPTASERLGPSVWLNTTNGDNFVGGAIYANLVSSGPTPSPGIKNNVVVAPANTIPAANVYHLIAVTYSSTQDNNDGKGKGISRIFVDGVQVASATVGAVSLRTVMEFRVGYSTRTWPGGAIVPHSFIGALDQVRVLNRAVTATEAAQVFSGGRFRVTRPTSNPTCMTATCISTSPAAGADFTDGATQTITFARTIGSVPAATTPVLSTGANVVQFTFSDRAGNVGSIQDSVTFEPTDPRAPTVTAMTAISPNSISYTWTAPTNICTATPPEYKVYNCSDVLIPGIPAAPTATTTTESGFGVNTKVGRKIAGIDKVQIPNREGAKSACAQTYTAANQPQSLTAPYVSTGSMRVTWDPNGNPGYTRYELTRYFEPTRDAGFGVSTLISLDDNYTGTDAILVGLQPGTTYYLRVRSFNGNVDDPDVPGGTAAVAPADLDQATLVESPTLSATGLSDTTVRWTWTAITGADNYELRDEPGNALLCAGNVTTCDTGGYTADVAVTAHVTARGPAGFGAPSNSKTVSTRALPPSAFALASVTSNTATLQWSRNGNPAYTNFELRRSTAATMFGIISTFSAPGTSFVADKLLPETSYYFQLRAKNRDGVLSAPDAAIPAAFTLKSGSVSSSSGPATTYEAPLGAVAVWHFDESTGTALADASGHAHVGQLRCDFAGCVSTPTFQAGPAGLGSALRMPGQSGSFVRVSTSALFDWPGGATGLTLSAWVNPTSALQTPDAAVVARGSSTDFGYALDVTNGRWRFRLRDAGNTVRTLDTGAALLPGDWHQIVAVWDPVGPKQRFFVDGVFVASAAVPAASRAADAGKGCTIGNRPFGGTATFNAPFSGGIDELRVINKALSDAEVGQEYSASRPNLFVAAPPNDGIRLTIPANAFGGAVRFYITRSPQSNPIRTSANVGSALNSPPTGFAYVPDSVVEIVAQVNGLDFETTLGSSVTVTVPYPDADGNGLVDGTSPPLDASLVRMFTLNNSTFRWESLTTSVDRANRRASGLASHFSVFALFGTTGISTDLSVRVYPVPWKPGTPGSFDSGVFGGRSGLIFDKLPAEGDIRIFTLTGELVVELKFDSTNAGTFVWDGKNSGGRNVASGVYFARVKAAGGGSAILKLAIER